MASKTTNYGLNKHSPQDFYNVEARNENWDKIDEALAAADPTKITAKAEPADGDGVMIADSADGGKAKRLLWSSVKAALGKLFVPLARKINGKALEKDVTLTGENIAVSTTDSTPISGAVKYRTNPNFLDNWYFGNPANLRGGYYVPQGAIIYSDSSLSEGSKIGAAAYAGPVVEFTNTYVKLRDVKFPTQYYYAAVSAAIPGYCTAGYTVDRWKSNGDHNVVGLGTGEITVTDNETGWSGIEQRFENWSELAGKQVSVSALGYTEGVNHYLHLQYGDNTTIKQMIFPSGSLDLLHFTVTVPTSIDRNFRVRTVRDGSVSGNSTLHLLAAKLELGTTQTLAHQENGVWVLNEIPDFGEQLRRCVYYAEKIEDGNTPVITNATFIPAGATSATFVLPYERKRTSPSIRFNDVSNYRVIVRSMSGNTTAFGISNISILDVGTTKASVLVTFSSATSQDWYGYLQRSDNTTGGYAFISADI